MVIEPCSLDRARESRMQWCRYMGEDDVLCLGVNYHRVSTVFLWSWLCFDSCLCLWLAVQETFELDTPQHHHQEAEVNFHEFGQGSSVQQSVLGLLGITMALLSSPSWYLLRLALRLKQRFRWFCKVLVKLPIKVLWAYHLGWLFCCYLVDGTEGPGLMVIWYLMREIKDIFLEFVFVAEVDC